MLFRIIVLDKMSQNVFSHHFGKFAEAQQGDVWFWGKRVELCFAELEHTGDNVERQHFLDGGADPEHRVQLRLDLARNRSIQLSRHLHLGESGPIPKLCVVVQPVPHHGNQNLTNPLDGHVLLTPSTNFRLK